MHLLVPMSQTQLHTQDSNLISLLLLLLSFHFGRDDGQPIESKIVLQRPNGSDDGAKLLAHRQDGPDTSISVACSRNHSYPLLLLLLFFELEFYISCKFSSGEFAHLLLDWESIRRCCRVMEMEKELKSWPVNEATGAPSVWLEAQTERDPIWRIEQK